MESKQNNSTLSSLAILTCWYGPYPWYLPHFIHSCSFNPTVDFYIITDNTVEIKNKPENVKIIFKTLDDIKNIGFEKLGFDINIEYPYKLCDFKPAYGYFFEDIIENYDFWGQSDLDIIFGNIRDFINPEMLETYDFISVRHDYTTGCFALYRNNTVMNTFFKRSKDYKTVFTNEKHYCFDECNFVWDELHNGISIFDIETEIESFTHLIKHADYIGEISAHFDFILMEGMTGKITFDNGKIIYKNKYEAVLYHLFWLKKVYNPNKVPAVLPNLYHISPTRIYYNRKGESKYKFEIN